MAVKQLSNPEVIQILKEVHAAMQVKDYIFFRTRAYENAITSLENLTSSIYDLWENNRLESIPGIGGGLAQHFNDLFTKGVVKEFETAREDLPEGMFALIGLRSVGPKRAFKLAKAFGLSNRETAIEELKNHAKKGEIQVLPGFGEKSEKEILNAVELSKKTKSEKPRMLLVHAELIAERILKHMEELDSIEKIAVLGSFRRRNPTIGDLDFAVATEKPEEIIKHFLKFAEIDEILVQGEHKVMVNLKNGVQVDLRVTEPDTYGAMLQYNTGNVQHNINLRTHALEKGFSLSEYGIKIKKAGTIKKVETEKEFYEFLDLEYIPPELRYGGDEIECAKKNKLPKLIELEDIKGDLHIHTTFSDGVNSIDEVSGFAAELGYEYIGITDHAPSVKSRGYKEVEKIFEKTRETINRLNEVGDIKVLYGYEVDILAKTGLALPNEFLKELDYVVAGIHTSFNQDKELITKRLISAIEHEHVNIIAHPVGRLINKREACDANWEKVLDATKANNKILEINSQPERLDLPDDLVYQAVKKGVRLVINTDAHSLDQLTYMRYGIDVARRGWCEKKDVVNTLGLEEFFGVFRLTLHPTSNPL